MGSSHESEPSCGRGEIESVTPTQRRVGGRVGIPDGAVNAAAPMMDCYSAKSGRFARNLELLGPIAAHWLGRALLVGVATTTDTIHRVRAIASRACHIILQASSPAAPATRDARPARLA